MPPLPKLKTKRMISLDTETTGLDFYHGAGPFLVTTCDDNGDVNYWHWSVDPFTREIKVPKDDLREIQNVISSASRLILQNTKFDFAALNLLFRKHGRELRWNWKIVEDTLVAGHLLASNAPHDLTSMVLVYLRENIQPFEDRMDEAVKEARKIGKKLGFRIAAKDLPEMPSAKEKTFKYDLWLPKEVAKHEQYPLDHPWWNLTEEYANIDSVTTLALFKAQEEHLKLRNLEAIYRERIKILPIVSKMEEVGVTVSKVNLQGMTDEYTANSARLGRVCTNIAKGYNYDLVLPKGATNQSLHKFAFEHLKLEPMVNKKSKTGAPSLDKAAFEHYSVTLKPGTKQRLFVSSLSQKRKDDTAISYMNSYRRFGLQHPSKRDWLILHPWVNPCGSGTLRWTSQNPNEQNISKQQEECPHCDGDNKSCSTCNGTGEVSHNIRRCFGPAPGREWWSIDYDNLELRIPAYEAGERAMIEIFEKPNDPPYFGSYHLLNCSIIYPDEFWPIAEIKGEFKKRYKSTWYQYGKNFGFAVSYGAVIQSGTADRAAHKEGAQLAVMNMLKEHTKLNQSQIDFANKYGYVQTIPDVEIDPHRGYPLVCGRNPWNKISPTIPLNYHVQGTACWVVLRAMIKVQEYLDGLNKKHGKDMYRIIMNVHDEVVYDFPYKKDQGNAPIIRKVRSIMESIGNNISVPLTCGVDYHSSNWGESEKLVSA